MFEGDDTYDDYEDNVDNDYVVDNLKDEDYKPSSSKASSSSTSASKNTVGNFLCLVFIYFLHKFLSLKNIVS